MRRIIPYIMENENVWNHQPDTVIIVYIHYIDINVWVKKNGIFNGIPSSSNMAMQLESPERNLVGGIPTLSEKYEFVSWDDDSQLNGKIKFMFQTTNQ